MPNNRAGGLLRRTPSLVQPGLSQASVRIIFCLELLGSSALVMLALCRVKRSVPAVSHLGPWDPAGPSSIIIAMGVF